ncbi:MAG: RecX family transcriptional regulator [Alteraurantiacibacter sp.]
MHGNKPNRRRTPRPRKPLNQAVLEELALAYVARFATSAAKLERYLQRKLRERGWDEEAREPPDLAALVARYVERDYIDDTAYAKARAGDLLRRGYGANRVRQALGQAGIGEQVRDEVAPGEATKRRAALHLARKRGFGPFALQPADREKREKHIAAMLRAGHTFDHTRSLIDAPDENAATQWLAEAEDLNDDDD